MTNKLKKKDGFTLAELLIVVAIIGVLVAISIPIFTAQLEKAREATDEANIRAAYAEVAVGVLDGTLNSESDLSSYTVHGTQKQERWQTVDGGVVNIGGYLLEAPVDGGLPCEFAIDEDGNIVVSIGPTPQG